MQSKSYESDSFVSQNADMIRQRIVAAVGQEWGQQARVSRETGIPRGHLSQIISGKRSLKLRHIRVIATACSVSFAWLMTGEGHPGDVDIPTAPGVSSAHGDSSSLSINQVGKLLAAAERERLTPDERALLLKYQSLPPDQRARLWALLNAGAADPPEEAAAALNDAAPEGKGVRR